MVLVVTNIHPGSISDLFDRHPVEMARYHRGLTATHAHYASTITGRWWVTSCVVLWGPTGTGKTLAILRAVPSAKLFTLPRPNGSVIYWDGYLAHEYVFLDDFYSWINWDLMLRLLDRTSFHVPCRGYSTPFLARVIFITSNQHPRQWWRRVENKTPLYRRLSEPGYGSAVLHVSTPTADVLRLRASSSAAATPTVPVISVAAVPIASTVTSTRSSDPAAVSSSTDIRTLLRGVRAPSLPRNVRPDGTLEILSEELVRVMTEVQQHGNLSPLMSLLPPAPITLLPMPSGSMANSVASDSSPCVPLVPLTSRGFAADDYGQEEYYAPRSRHFRSPRTQRHDR